MRDLCDYVQVPYTVVIDTREQAPYSFAGLRGDASQGENPLLVPTVVRGLKTGDYSIAGFEDSVAVERKSLEDLYGTLGQGRDRFEREFERLQAMRVAALVIEADWWTILKHPPAHSKLRPKTIMRTAFAWTQRFPTVHWWAFPTRGMCEQATFRILDRFYQDSLIGALDRDR